MTPKHIAVATDLSPSSMAALRLALSLAAPLGADVTLVHALEPTAIPPGLEAFALEGMPAGWDERLTRARRDHAERRLDELAASASSLPSRIKTRLLVGTLPEVITDQIGPMGIDLLVVGTHGRRGLARFFLGSVAERLLRSASCPVLVVHPDEPTPG